MDDELTYTAFSKSERICAGTLDKMLIGTKDAIDRGASAVLIFADQTGQQVDFDFRGTREDVLARHAPAATTRCGPGRPKLGVVCREISLLPRHWAWLEQQPQGLSGALRRLVEAAMKHEPNKERARLRREAAGKFMWAMAGDLPGFEEASRALYASRQAALEAEVVDWPKDVRDHLLELVRQSVQLENESAPSVP
jgi:uncharacterized protein